MSDPAERLSTIRWQPDGAARHAHDQLAADDGQRVPAICGHEVVIRYGLGEVDWLAPSCGECMRLAWRRMNPDLPYPLDARRG